jgi:hypothetical protein
MGWKLLRLEVDEGRQVVCCQEKQKLNLVYDELFLF